MSHVSSESVSRGDGIRMASPALQVATSRAARGPQLAARYVRPADHGGIEEWAGVNALLSKRTTIAVCVMT